ncbi:MAG: peptide deformylase [Candidatus Dojkabacteria bacterium]|nr:peptide deformylase [Candidatus Dojkabacteria bacterium]
MLKVLQFPDKGLRKLSATIEDSELESVVSLGRNMLSYIKKNCHKTFGSLAACQIGILKKIFVIRLPEIETIVVNPEIVSEYGGTTKSWEMCLSVPDVVGRVRRHKKCEVEYQNEKFETIKKELTQPLSRIFLHEYDHLEGKLFLDRIEHKQSDLMQVNDYFSRRKK